MGTRYQNYKVVYDYHTHTTYSHGKGSIEDNVKAAISAGLSGIGISDHGPGHLTYGIKRGSIPVMRREIEELRRKYPEFRLYMSVEANLVSSGNYLDLLPDEFGDFDYVIAGYHYGVLHGRCVRNYVDEHLGIRSKALRIRNTEMTVKAIYENPIRILTHPGDKGPFDLDEIAKACADRKTLMEINTRHTHLTLEEIRQVAKYDVQFVVSSDAHTSDRVGDVSEGIERAVRAGIDLSRIVNIKPVSEQESEK